MSLSDVFAMKSHCQRFFSLLMGLQVFALDISGTILADAPQSDGTVKKDVETGCVVYVSQTEQRAFKELETRLTYPLAVLGKERFEQTLLNWFAAMKTLLPVCEVFFSMFKASGMYLQTRFLHLSQAIEGFLRVTNRMTYLPDDEFKPIMEALTRAIPPAVPDTLRNKLKSQIKYGNEPSLHKRLRAMMRGLSDEERAIICENTDHFIRAIVDTRNDMTHLDEPEEGELILQNDDLYHASNKLELLLVILLLNHLGLPTHEVLSQIRKSGRFDLNPFVLPPELLAKE